MAWRDRFSGQHVKSEELDRELLTPNPEMLAVTLSAAASYAFAGFLATHSGFAAAFLALSGVGSVAIAIALWTHESRTPQTPGTS